MADHWSQGFPQPNIVAFMIAFAFGLPWSLLTLFNFALDNDRATYGMFWLGIAFNWAALLFFAFGRKKIDTPTTSNK
jgi:hypothetical protein